MPLSKKRMRERKQEDRMSNLTPLDVKPKHPIGYQYPDGRCRLPDMSLVQPRECEKVELSLK